MVEHVYVPPTGAAPRRTGPFIPPLLIVPFLVYNLVAFIFLGGNPAGWSNTAFGIGTVSILEHMLSMIVFVVILVEFLLIGAASSSVFFILLVMSLIDVVAGFTMSITSATRDMSMAGH